MKILREKGLEYSNTSSITNDVMEEYQKNLSKFIKKLKNQGYISESWDDLLYGYITDSTVRLKNNSKLKVRRAEFSVRFFEYDLDDIDEISTELPNKTRKFLNELFTTIVDTCNEILVKYDYKNASPWCDVKLTWDDRYSKSHYTVSVEYKFFEGDGRYISIRGDSGIHSSSGLWQSFGPKNPDLSDLRRDMMSYVENYYRKNSLEDKTTTTINWNNIDLEEIEDYLAQEASNISAYVSGEEFDYAEENGYSIEPKAFESLDDYDWIVNDDYRNLVILQDKTIGAIEGTYNLTKDDMDQISKYLSRYYQ